MCGGLSVWTKSHCLVPGICTGCGSRHTCAAWLSAENGRMAECGIVWRTDGRMHYVHEWQSVENRQRMQYVHEWVYLALCHFGSRQEAGSPPSPQHHRREQLACIVARTPQRRCARPSPKRLLRLPRRSPKPVCAARQKLCHGDAGGAQRRRLVRACSNDVHAAAAGADEVAWTEACSVGVGKGLSPPQPAQTRSLGRKPAACARGVTRGGTCSDRVAEGLLPPQPAQTRSLKRKPAACARGVTWGGTCSDRVAEGLLRPQPARMRPFGRKLSACARGVTWGGTCSDKDNMTYHAQSAAPPTRPSGS
eukprot:365098-Chlamydomonas_euryale.AAC.3